MKTNTDRMPPAEVARLVTDHMRRTISRATDAEGHTITIVEIDGDRVTILVSDPDPVTGGVGPHDRTSTVVLSKAELADLAESVSRWLNRP